MLINGINPTIYGVTSYNKEIGIAEVTTYDDWLRQAPLPTIIGQKEYKKQIDLSFFIRGTTEEIVTTNISNLVSQLKRCVLQFDGLSFYYVCTIKSSSVKKHSILQQQLEVVVEGYAHKSSIIETLSSVSSKSINISGNLPTPAVVTITAPIDTISLTLTGLGPDSMIIKNLKANIPVIINGELGTVISNGLNKFNDTDMWQYPMLQPGVNVIGINSSTCLMSISYKPKYI